MLLEGGPAVWKSLSVPTAALFRSSACKWISLFPCTECPQAYVGNITLRRFTLALFYLVGAAGDDQPYLGLAFTRERFADCLIKSIF